MLLRWNLFSFSLIKLLQTIFYSALGPHSFLYRTVFISLITHASLVHFVLVSPFCTNAPRWYIAYTIIVTRSFSACPYFDKANKLNFLRLFTTFNVQSKTIFLSLFSYLFPRVYVTVHI